MPFFFSERLPVPALKSYLTLSSLIFIASLIYGKDRTYKKITEEDISYYEAFLAEPFCLWAMVNMAYCGLFLFGKVIQNYVLGQMRNIEQQHLQDKFWNFIFYKLIFVFGVINAQSLHEVLCWSAWFSTLGFLHIFEQLCRDRYQYVTSSPATPTHKHVKLLTLVFAIFASSIALSIFAISLTHGWNIFAFMMAECLLLALKSMHVIFRYTMQLCDLQQTGLWDGKAKIIYYSDLALEAAILCSDLVYHFHMLIWSNVFISMASLVLYWNIRTIFGEIKKRIRKHQNYKKIMRNVEVRFPMATQEELDAFADHCAICWDTMETARKLPCSHLYHHACLCSWLQQDVSCPACRQSLATDIGIARQNSEGIVNDNAVDLQEMNDNRNDNRGGLRNYFFYLDGQQIANWFPSFSIEVFHGRNEASDQNLDQMAEQLYSMFPHISREAIMNDLRNTNSVDATADNILEGNLPAIAPEEAPVIISCEEQSPIIQDGDGTEESFSTIEVSAERPSDCESLVEESSGTEECSLASPADNEGSDNCRKVVHAKAVKQQSGLRRRYLTKTLSGSAEQGEQESSQPLPPNLLNPHSTQLVEPSHSEQQYGEQSEEDNILNVEEDNILNVEDNILNVEEDNILNVEEDNILNVEEDNILNVEEVNILSMEEANILSIENNILSVEEGMTQSPDQTPSPSSLDPPT